MGTNSRVEMPAPGTLRGNDARSSAAAKPGSSPDELRQAIARFRASDNWKSLQPIVFVVLGHQTFGLGVIYGMGENVAVGMVGLAEIGKTFLLADLYDRSRQSAYLGLTSPVALVQQLAAEVGIRAFGSTLEQAFKDREALIKELTYAVTHLSEVFENIRKDYTSKWERFEKLSREARLSSRFEAGRIFGEVLADVLTLIAGGAAAVKTVSKIPRLARLAQAGRNAAVARPKPPASGRATTPSKPRPPEPPPAPVPVNPELAANKPTKPRTPTSPIERGAQRTARFGQGWPKASLKETIAKVAGERPIVTREGSKTIYTNPDTGKRVIYDRGGNYFRVQDPSIPSKRNFCDADGRPISPNKTETGPSGNPRQTGKSYDEYQQETHFLNTD